ncbi:MAG: hypothetical protein ABI759_08280 [Candidatus Solibacter sp.]
MSLRYLSVLVFSAVLCRAQSGVINTVIGTGAAGASGDGGPGANAQLNTPNGVAVDAAGNVYIADYVNSRIRKLLTSDFTQTIAGCGPPPACLDQSEGRLAGATAIFSPWDVVVDAVGNFYFTDSGLQRVRKVGTNGILTNYAGSGAPGVSSTGFSGDGGPATAAKLNNPVGLAVDAQGNIYVADLNNQRVRKIDTLGIINTIAGSGTVNANLGTPGGFSGDGGPATSARLNAPHGVGVDAAGNVYIADTTNYRIRKVARDGIISTVAGTGEITLPFLNNLGDGGPATRATLIPWDVKADAAGNLYISDWLGHRIRKVDAATGIITTVAGTGTAGFSGDRGAASSAAINAPTGLTVDSQGNVYFADSLNHRIRKINAPPLGPPAIRSTNPVLPAFLGNAGFSSNMYVEIYGENFSRVSRLWSGADFTGANAPTSLEGVRVTVNNKPAFIYYVSPGQININVPEDTATGPVPIRIETAQGTSNAISVTRSRLSPTLLTATSFKIGGKQYVVALTPNFTSYIGRPNMIPGVAFVAPKPGDTVSIYALGLGPTNPPTQAGVAAAQNSEVALPLQIKIGGIEASVSFKGLLQGTIGLYQLNVVIPSVVAGDQTIELTVDGVRNEQNLVIVVGP